MNTAHALRSPIRVAPATYAAVSHEYYVADLHPTCRNLRDGSLTAINDFLTRIHTDNSSICEVGAGKSAVAEHSLFHCRSLSKTLITDISVDMLKYSYEFICRGAQLVVSDVRSLPIADGSIDVLVSCLGDPYNVPDFWAEVYRVLSNSGKCIFTTPSHEWAKTFRSSNFREKDNLAAFDLSDGNLVYLPSLVFDIKQQTSLISSFDLTVDDVVEVSTHTLTKPISSKLFSDGRLFDHVVTAYIVSKAQCGVKHNI